MPLTITPVTPGQLPNSPLELVVCQVRHDARPVDAAMALAVQAEFGGPEGPYGRIDQVDMHTTTMQLGAQGPETTHTTTGWHLRSSDGHWTVALLPDHFSIETTRYTTWNEFKPRFAALIDAIEGCIAPTMEQRVGLRYVDRLRGLGVTDPHGWQRWIHPAILGPVLHADLGSAITATRQQIDLDLGRGRICVLRHGTVTDPSGESTYLLDFDVYRQQARGFSGVEIVASVHEFHETADAIFFNHVITRDLHAHLKGEQND